METDKTKYRFVEWLSAEEMHEASAQWLSELKFISDEQLFLNNLVTSYTSQLLSSDVFKESKEIIGQLQKAEREVEILLKKVQTHAGQLEIMVDGVDQLKMEKAYIATHKELLIGMRKYKGSYREIKERLFKLVSSVLKKDKQKRLLN